MCKVGTLMVQRAILELMRLNFLSAKITPDYKIDGVPALAIAGALTQLVRKG